MSRGPFYASTKQFACPTGFMGRVAGFLMAKTNEAMIDAAAELLDVQPDERVLEIGFGPGRLIARVARHATGGRVAGVDLSAVMVERAARETVA